MSQNESLLTTPAAKRLLSTRNLDFTLHSPERPNGIQKSKETAGIYPIETLHKS
jgi:hypothetical protein